MNITEDIKVENGIPDDYNIKWQYNGLNETITISKCYFEHLLNCLANQKFIGEIPPNGDALAIEKSEYNRIQAENQAIIDKAWTTGMFILCLPHKMQETYKNTIEKYCEIWNKNIPYIQSEIDKRYSNEDKNISFKWLHLVPQEIEMWIRLCCFSDAVIDCKNEKYTHGMISKEDFDCIVDRRGFTPSMIKFLLNTLKEIGIGNNL